MKKLTKKLLAVAVVSFITLPAFASTPDEQAVNQKLQEIFHTNKDFSPYPMQDLGLKDMYRFKVKDGIYGYTDKNVDHIFNGDLILTHVQGAPAGKIFILKNNQPYPPVTSQDNTSVSTPATTTQSVSDSKSSVQTTTSASTQSSSPVENRLLSDSNEDSNSAPTSVDANTSSSDYTQTTGVVSPETNESIPAVSTDSKMISLNLDAVTYVKNSGEKSGSIFYSRLPYQNSFTETYGKGEREFTVFVDPDCPFCRQFDKNLKENPSLVNATVHFFYTPLNIHPYARTHADFLWSQPDRAEAYNSWMNYLEKAQETDPNVDQHINVVFADWKKATNRKEPTTEELQKSDNTIVKNFQIAASLGIKSTPTMMFKNSSVVAHTATADDVNTFLNFSDKNPKLDEVESLRIPSTLIDSK